MPNLFLSRLSRTLSGIDDQGLTKREREITSPQGAVVRVQDRAMFCAPTTTLGWRTTLC
jgi:glycine C-acetyltransferase